MVQWQILGLTLCTTLGLGQMPASEPFIGEYTGLYQPDDLVQLTSRAFVVALGQDQYSVRIQVDSAEGDRDLIAFELRAQKQGDHLDMHGFFGGHDWQGRIDGESLVLSTTRYDAKFKLTKLQHRSPSAGLAPPKGAVVLLAFQPGSRPALTAWRNKEWPVHSDGSMEIPPNKGASNQSLREFGSIERLHIDFMLPLQAENRGSARGNSGIFLNDISYEVQLLDSFGRIPTTGDCGALYTVSAPRVNACYPPGVWQTFDISFQAPRLDDKGKTVKPARFTVVHNGIRIQDDVAVSRCTIGPDWPQKERGPIVLQNKAHPLRFRNIWLIEAAK